jgi:hypothetical protein
MVSPQSWFLRELRIIDHRYRVIPVEEAQSYRIVMDAEVIVESPMRGAFRITGPKTVDVFQHLNDAALTTLRYRKYLGRKMKLPVGPREGRESQRDEHRPRDDGRRHDGRIQDR